MNEIEQKNDSLTISYYMADFSVNDPLKEAVLQFRKTHPDVKINIERAPRVTKTSGEDEWDTYFLQLSTEVMAGRGPDLFWVDPYYMDLYKMMQAGAFADLGPFMEGDPDPVWEDCNAGVIAGGRYKDCQYIIPLSYSIPVMMSEKSLLEKAGFDYGSCTDFSSLWRELSDYSALYSEDPSLLQPMRSRWRFWDFASFAGIPWLDMENHQVDFSDPRWPEFFEQYKRICSAMPDDEEQQASQQPLPESPVRLMEGKFLQELYMNDLYSQFLLNLRGVSSMGEPCLLPVYDVNGGVQASIRYGAAVRRNSPNRQLAYEFIKALLSPESQLVSSGIAPDFIPVSNEALKQTLQESEKELTRKIYQSSPVETPDYAPIPHEITQVFWEATQKVNGAYFPTDARRQLYKAMEPFLKGKTTYEEAIKEAEETLKIYVSE